MFAGFNLFLEPKDKLQLRRYNNYKIYDSCKNDVRGSIDDYWSPDGTLEGTEIEQDWFPDIIDAHVFISHSHEDEIWAKKLASWLYQKYSIKSFVDSMVWGYANDLLKQIDDEYSESQYYNNKGIYDYNKRNQSTAHVHMILQGALAKMIDKCECLIFVNTPNSISTYDINDDSKTASPWIYNELLMAKMLRRKIPERYQLLSESVEDKISKLKINYQAYLDNLEFLELEDIEKAGRKFTHGDAEDVLDQLYKDKGLM